MRILVSAYSCHPRMTSEPRNAWCVINHALSRGHEVWTVIEQSEYEKETLEYLEAQPMPGFHPVFFQLPAVWVKLLRTAGMSHAIYYHLWQHKLLRVAAELHRQVGFDLTHHVTFGRYWSPCGVRRLGIPFIWGPVGAAEYAPASFVSELPWRERVFEWIRDNVRALAVKDPALRETARAATIGIGVTRESCEALRKLGVRRVEQSPQAFLPDDDLAQLDRLPPPPEGPFRAICAGRLLHWKGFHLAIRAFAIFVRNEPEAELWIVNDGPFRRELEKTAAQSGVASRVRFLGRLPNYDQVLAKLAEAHVLMHPALHEAFGKICEEALAMGRPLVCLDIGGPASQVTPETGYAAPATSPAEAVEAMAAFLTRVAADRRLLASMSAKARAHAREKFTMRNLGAALDAYYQEAVGNKKPRLSVVSS
ncbi:MAG TPA: glycosyltransferase family 4 protein [Candidatus Acidoferrum sp.]|nr:glycosyltransferase family 4 protein [Candidatus Acidoferrum sp.]